MPVATTMAFEPNLATLSCRAASELDNLLLDRLHDFVALPKLVDTLKNIDKSSQRLLNPSDAIVINYAITNARISSETLRTTDQLVRQAENIRIQLESVVSNPRENSPDDLKKLRAFCIELSKSAASYARSLEEVEPKHPFRR